MVTGELRSQIDRLWLEFHSGGITDPLTVIVQMSYLLFCRMLDEAETNKERMARHSGKPAADLMFGSEQQDLRWSHFRHSSGEPLLAHVRDNVFPFLRTLGERQGMGSLMKDAQLLIVKPSLLASAIATIDGLNLGSTDTKGDLYEYLLSKLTTAGINGQFRTPRHIQEAMVRMVRPKPTDTIADPACGTAGFLVKVMEYLRKEYSSPEMVFNDADGNPVYPGDKLAPWQQHIQTRLLTGFDFDQTMLRMSSMNLLLHGIDGQCIHYQDTLSDSFKDNFPEQARDYFDLVLANPPFKGNLDKDDIAEELSRVVKSTKTELLFLARMVSMLKLGGRCAVIVPDGVLFGSSKAHVALRKMLVEENQLDGVVSLPSGVFKPYAGVSTAILFFTRGGNTSNVFFFDVQADGYSLDDKRTKVDADDLPELVRRWDARDPQKDTDRTSQAFFVSVDDIRGQNYDLSLNKYKEQVYEAEQYDAPEVILGRIEALEKEVQQGLGELRGMLGC